MNLLTAGGRASRRAQRTGRSRTAIALVLVFAALAATARAANDDEIPKSDGEVIWEFFRDRVVVPVTAATATRLLGSRVATAIGGFLAASAPIGISDQSTYSSDPGVRAQQEESAYLRQKREALKEVEAEYQLELRGGRSAPPPTAGASIQLPQARAEYNRHRHPNTPAAHRAAAMQAAQRARMLRESADASRQAALRQIARQRAQAESARPQQAPPPRRLQQPRLPSQPPVRVAPPR